jgi:nucleotide-binding universal stress UspA family protein
MPRLSRILVHVDPGARRDPAVAAGIRLAQRLGARLTIADVLAGVPLGARGFVTRPIEQELLEYRRERLARLAGRATGVDADTIVLRGETADALVAEVSRAGYDLLIRSHHPTHRGGPLRPYGPIDMRLLRECPCPVWLVGPRLGTRRGPVVAAVQAGAEDAGSVALRKRVIDFALEMRDLLGGRLVLLYAWSVFAEAGLHGHLNEARIAAYVAETHALAEKELRAVVAEGGAALKDADAVLVKGEPHAAIAGYAKRHGASLVVMGTVGRSGLSGALIGNTAERVLRELRGSVLAVKPEGRPRG